MGVGVAVGAAVGLGVGGLVGANAGVRGGVLSTCFSSSDLISLFFSFSLSPSKQLPRDISPCSALFDTSSLSFGFGSKS